MISLLTVGLVVGTCEGIRLGLPVGFVWVSLEERRAELSIVLVSITRYT